MSDIKKLLLFIFVTFCLIMPVYAASNYLVLLDSVNIRSGPSVNYKRLELGKLGSTYNLKK